LAHRTAFDGESADFALSIHDLFIGQHGAEFRTPVHRNVGDIGESHTVGIGARVGGDRFGALGGRIEPGIVELEKDPLRPPEVFRIGRADFA